MLTRTVTYKDFDNNDKTKTLHFNLTKMQLMDLEMKTEPGKDKISERVKAVQTATEFNEVFELFDDLLKASYGIRKTDEDGDDYFDQDPKLWDKFRKSPAYDELMFGTFTEPGESAKFVNELIPDLSSVIAQAERQGRPVPQDFKKAVQAQKESVRQSSTPEESEGTLPSRNTFEHVGVNTAAELPNSQPVDLNSLSPAELTEWVAKNQQGNA